MERISEALRRFLRQEQKGANSGANIADPGTTPSPLLDVLDLEELASRRVNDVSLQIKPFDEDQEIAEAGNLSHRLSLAAQGLELPVAVTRQDYQRWLTLQRTFREGIDPIHTIQRQKLAEVDQFGAASHLEVTMYHVTDMGCELVARKNIRQQRGLARKYGVEERIGSFLHLLEFYHGLVTSLKIGDVTLQDFLDPQERSLVGRYRFLAQASLVVHQNLYDEILPDNQESPKNAYPNMIRRVMWTLPATMEALLIHDPDTVEQVYRNSRYPLNEIGSTASQLIRGVQATRSAASQLILHPRSEDFQTLKQTVQKYLSSSDKQVVILALNLLGLDAVAGIRQLYRQSRRYVSEGIEEEFFSQMREAVRGYAREASRVMPVPDENDMDLIADLDDVVDSAGVPSFEQLGQTVSAIFQKTSQTSYTVDPTGVEWPISPAQAVMVRFDRNRPRKFHIVLTYATEDGQELTEVTFGLDTQKSTMEWGYLADPIFPENAKVANFRSLLLMATRSILRDVQRQAQEQYDARLSKRAAPIAQSPAKVKRERFDDPVYQVRKEIRAEQRQAQSGESAHTVPTGGIVEAARVKNEVVVPTGVEQARLLQALSPEDRQIMLKILDEFNQFGTGGELTKKVMPGPDGRERWTLRVACSVPKGVRVLLAPVEFSKGLRRFEIIDIRYRKDVYPKNKI